MTDGIEGKNTDIRMENGFNAWLFDNIGAAVCDYECVPLGAHNDHDRGFSRPNCLQALLS